MPNPLTGDFAAVLQISGGTLNRLAASMHQNAGANPKLPSFPHSVALRLGDGRATDGVRGSMWAQVSVPRIELINGETERFNLEVGLRARYAPDHGTQPLPEFIHGTVRAQYRMEDVDPTCLGWGRIAADYVWIRVVEDSVSFTGTAVDETGGLSIPHVVDEVAADALITRQLAVLLKTTFQASPHKVSKRFRRGAMRSLSAPIGGSAVAAPISLDGAAPTGRLDSIGNILLEERDFGVAVSKDYILSTIQPTLDALRDAFLLEFRFHHRTYVDLGALGDVDVVTVNIDYRVTLTDAHVEWIGHLPFVSGGLIRVKISGHALTQKAIFNISFDVTQVVALTFDGGSETISATALGAPTIALGGTLAGVVEGFVKPRIEAAVKPRIQSALDDAGGLDLGSRKAELITQLRTIDDHADAGFDEAVFGPDGVILRGWIALAPRRGPVVTFEQTAGQDGYTALAAWLPGGRIDELAWSWSWFGGDGDAGKVTWDDRFLLRRPGGRISRFGRATAELRVRLPGLDGGGVVCLSIKGVQADPQTGGLVPVEARRQCRRFGFDIALVTGAYLGQRLFVRERAPAPPGGPPPELALLEVGGGRPPETSSNTLVVHAGAMLDEETAATLHEGIARCERTGAGLLVTILVTDGVLGRAGGGRPAVPEDLAMTLEAPVLVTEDVRGSWAAALAVPAENGEPSWRLVSPGGGVTWARDGRVPPDELAGALDACLLPSPAPAASHLRPGRQVGELIDHTSLSPVTIGELLASRCPPPPFGRTGIGHSVVAFVQRDSEASLAHVRRLSRAHAADEEAGAGLTVVVDGATAEQAYELAEDLGGGLLAIGDPDGVVAGRFGVRYWPTTVTVDEAGRVRGYEPGAADLGEHEPGDHLPDDHERRDHESAD